MLKNRQGRRDRSLEISFRRHWVNDDLIHSRLVIRLLDKGTKRKLPREKSLALNKALDIACSDKITSQPLVSITCDSGATKEVNLVEKQKNVPRLVLSYIIEHSRGCTGYYSHENKQKRNTITLLLP